MITLPDLLSFSRSPRMQNPARSQAQSHRGVRGGRYVMACLLAVLGIALLPLDAAWAATVEAEIDPFVFRLSIFVLSIFVGYYVVWSVTPALHTPLMAVTNAISSVIVVGALLAVGMQVADAEVGFVSRFFGFLALVMAAVNIFGGFLVTQRMLAMYKKKER